MNDNRESIICPDCGSNNTVGWGHRNTKYHGRKCIRHCKECGKKYTVQPIFLFKKKYPKKIVDYATELTESLSLRDAAEKTNEKYNIKISYAAIRLWRNAQKGVSMNNKKKSSASKEQDDDWMYRSILNGAYSTKVNYDNNKIEQNIIDEFESLEQ